MNIVKVAETNAQMWTIVLVGMTTVFLCLIALVAMVSFFKKVFVKESKKKASTEPVAQSAQKLEPAKAGTTDSALVAIISAAIASANGLSPASFRIASIEQSGFNTPAWGHIDRTTRQ